MSLTITKGLQSEIYVPITPPAVWTPVKKELKDMSIALATAAEGFIRACAPVHAGFMGGGGNQEKFKHETGPAIAQMFKEEDVDAVILTAG